MIIELNKLSVLTHVDGLITTTTVKVDISDSIKESITELRAEAVAIGQTFRKALANG